MISIILIKEYILFPFIIKIEICSIMTTIAFSRQID